MQIPCEFCSQVSATSSAWKHSVSTRHAGNPWEALSTDQNNSHSKAKHTVSSSSRSPSKAVPAPCGAPRVHVAWWYECPFKFGFYGFNCTHSCTQYNWKIKFWKKRTSASNFVYAQILGRPEGDYYFCESAKFFDRNVRWEYRFKKQLSLYVQKYRFTCQGINE